MRLFCCFSVFVMIFSGVLAQPGSLDNTFARKGIGQYDFHANVLAEQGLTVLNLPDSKKIVVFTSNEYSKLTRLLPGGKTDMSFGEDGFSVAVDFRAICAITTTKGEIILAGLKESGIYNVNKSIIARFKADGRPDRTFHRNGLLEVTDFNITDLADYGEGKIVVVGGKINEPGATVARFLNNGNNDPTFGTDGRVKLSINMYFGYDIRSFIAVMPDGKITAGFNPYFSSFELIRLQANGSTDQDFGVAGKVITEIPNAKLKGMLLQPDGKIIAGGYFWYPNDFMMVRYNKNGSIDSSFGVNGRLVINMQSISLNGTTQSIGTIQSIALKHDGRIITASNAYSYKEPSSFVNSLRVLQFTANGRPDSSFHGDGSVNIDIGSNTETVSSVTIEDNDGIVLCGTYHQTKYGIIGNWDFVVCRLFSDGVPDKKFGAGGILLGYCPANSTSFTHTLLQPDGKLIVAGEISNGMDTAFLMVRLAADGAPDLSFGIDGLFYSLANLSDDGISHRPYDLRLAPNGEILATGSSHRYPGRIYYNNFLRLQTCSRDGRRDYPSDYNSGDRAIDYPWTVLSSAIMNNGNVLVLGYLDTEGRRDFSLTMTGYSGTFTTYLGGQDYINTIAVQPDNKILLGGRRNVSGNGTDFSLTRLNADGSPDFSFGIDGKQIVGFDRSDDDIRSIFIQPNGKIIAAGCSRNPLTHKTNFAVIRCNADGLPDSGFGQNGKQLIDFNEGPAAVNAITMEPNEKIILGGVLGNMATQPSERSNLRSTAFAITRLQTNGAIDQSFGKNGRVITNTGPGDDSLSRMLVSGNRLYAAGVNTSRKDVNTNQGIVAAYQLSGTNIPGNNNERTFYLQEQSTENKGKQLSVSVFPNPASNFFMITFSSSSYRPVTYSVIDAGGRIIEQKIVAGGDQNIKVGTSYQPGIYFITFRQDDLSKQLKLIKSGN